MHALMSGAAGAVTLTAIHETARRLIADPPRMDVVGMRAISAGFQFAGRTPPRSARLYAMTMAGDLLSNATFYSAIAAGRRPAVWTRAVMLGLAAGAGAVLLPEPLGLGIPPHSERRRTRALTVAYYLAGALATAATARAFSADARTRPNSDPPSGAGRQNRSRHDCRRPRAGLGRVDAADRRDPAACRQERGVVGAGLGLPALSARRRACRRWHRPARAAAARPGIDWPAGGDGRLPGVAAVPHVSLYAARPRAGHGGG